MKKLLLVTMIVAGLPVHRLDAQEVPTSAEPIQFGAQVPKPPPAVAQPQPAPGRRTTNVRFDISIRDEGAGAPPPKNVSLVVAMGTSGSLRSTAPRPGTDSNVPIFVAPPANPEKPGEVPYNPFSGPSVPLNVDVFARAQEGDKIMARVTVEYQPYSKDAKVQSATMRGMAEAWFDNGKPMVLSQTADPTSDRRTTIQVTATVLK